MQNISKIVQRNHDSLVIKKPESPVKRYKILKDYKGTYIEKEMAKATEEKMIYPIFRVFEAAKPERDRKLNIDPTHAFNHYTDSLMDYASIIGFKLSKPWTQYNRLIAVQIPLCPNNCWHCFLPKELYVGAIGSEDRYEELRAEDIVNRFLEQRKTDKSQNKQSNVLRITGGEPFLLPELLLECLEIIQQKKLDNEVFLWTETNIEPFIGDQGKAFMDKEDNKKILIELRKFKNFLVHPCFHGLDEEEFNTITGKNYNITLDKQIEGLRRLFKSGIDVYPTFGSNVCSPSNLTKLFSKLVTIHPNLPFRVALIEYKCDYEPVKSRIQGRTPSPKLYSRFANLRIWNELLIENFGVGYGVIPRHFITLEKDNKLADIQPESSTNIKDIPERLYFFKSSYRNQYHQEILELLALPDNHIIEVTYDKRHVQDDLFFHMANLPELYKTQKGIWLYVDTENVKLIPLREFEIVNIKEAGDIISATVKLNRYISFPSLEKDKLATNFRCSLKKYFGLKTLPPGGKYLLIGESFFNIDGYSHSGLLNIGPSQAFSDFKENAEIDFNFRTFHHIVPHLLSDKKMKRSVFYRIEKEKLIRTEENNTTYYEIAGGKPFKIKFDYYLPNYSEFDERKPEERTIHFESSSKTVEPIGPKKIVCSKYGNEIISFQTKQIKEKEKVTLTFWCKEDEFRAAKVVINILVKPQIIKDAVYSMVAALLFTIGTSGLAMYSKAITEGKSAWTSLWYSLKGFFWQPIETLIPNIFYILILAGIIFFLSWFSAKGVKPIKLS